MYRKYTCIYAGAYPVFLLTGKVRVSRFNCTWQYGAAFWRQIGNFNEFSYLFEHIAFIVCSCAKAVI